MTTHRAACSCGQLTATCEGAPLRVSICHCHACQRRTGAPFGQQARWPTSRVTLAGAATVWSRTGDGGGTATFRFCPTCGATVAFEIDAMPGMTAIPVGAFADATFPEPTISIYGDRKHAWVVLSENVEQLA